MMKFIFTMQRNIENFYKLILPFQMCISRQARSTQNKKFTYLCYISRKTWCMKWFFCMQLNVKVFYKMILSFWVCVTSLAQSTTCNKLASLQYLCKISRKTGRMKLIFCFQISIKSFFKLIQSFQMCAWPSMPKLSKVASLLFPSNILIKK